MWRQGDCALLHLSYEWLQNWFGFWKTNLLAIDVLMGRWTAKEMLKGLWGIVSVCPSRSTFTFLHLGLCSRKLTSMGCIRLVLLLCGFWLDFANEDTSRRGETQREKRKVEVLEVLCSLFWGHGLTVFFPIWTSPHWSSYLLSERHSKATATISVLEMASLLAPSDLGLLMVYPLGALPTPDDFP